jgi:hypothetical protein
VRTAAVLLLEINCQMLLSLLRGVMAYASDEDYSWLKERFGIDLWPGGGMGDRMLQKIVEEIRAGILPSDESVATALTEHLESRFEDVFGSLDFIVENSRVACNRQEALKESQDYGQARRSPQSGPTHSTPQYTLDSIEKLHGRVPEMLKAADRLDAFQSFSVLEKELEPIEDCVHGLAAEIDQAIQMEIDRRRGK